MEKYDKVFSSFNMEIYSNEYIEMLRNDSSCNERYIIPSKRQEIFLTTKAQVAFYTGIRGCGKTSALLMSAYPYIDKQFFSGVIFRNEKKDSNGTGGIADSSKFYLSQFGTYKSSQVNMKWDFNYGGSLSFEYYSSPYKEFDRRLRGKEFPFIGVDEVNQMPFSHFTFLFSDNRNAYGYKNMIRCTCNPDGDSWVYDFLRGTFRSTTGELKRKFIDENGLPIEDNNGKILYFFKYGDRADQCYWGETRDEVYEQGKKRMDFIFNSDPNFKKYIKHPKYLSISCTLVSGRVSDNTRMMASGGEYVSKMAMMSREEIEKDAIGRWIKSVDCSSLVNINDIDAFFSNSMQNDDYRCITADMSGNGRHDPAVLIYWEGFHIADAMYLMVGAETLKTACDDFMSRHNIPRERFCFDATSLGSTYQEYFSDAIQYNASYSAFDKKDTIVNGRKIAVTNYRDIRAQIFDNFSQRLKQRGYSVSEDVLHKNYGGKMFIDWIREEYPAIAKVSSNEYKFQIIAKKDMYKLVGHSPNWIDCLSLREYVELLRMSNRKKRKIGAYLL